MHFASIETNYPCFVCRWTYFIISKKKKRPDSYEQKLRRRQKKNKESREGDQASHISKAPIIAVRNNEKCYTCQKMFAKVIITAAIIKFQPYIVCVCCCCCGKEVSAFNKCAHLSRSEVAHRNINDQEELQERDKTRMGKSGNTQPKA